MNFQAVVQRFQQTGVMTYEVLLRDILAPAFMRGTWSSRWLGSIGAYAELIWQGASQAANVGYPSLAPNDALDLVGRNLNIERLIDEADGPYRDRLRTPFTTWEESGRAVGIVNQLETFGINDVEVYDIAAGWDPGDGNTSAAWRFWVVITGQPGWSLLEAAEDVIASDDIVAGVDGMTQTDYRNLRRIVHKWRAAHAAPIDFYIIFSGTLGTTSTAAAEAMVAAGDAVDLPITNQQASDTIYADETMLAGWYIEPR